MMDLFIYDDFVRATTKDFLFKKNNIIINYDKDGKPYIRSKDRRISISNKDNLIVFVLFDNNFDIGIDIESLEQNINIESFGKYFLDLDICRENYNKSDIIIIWSIKESIYKINSIHYRDIRLLYINHKEGTAISIARVGIEEYIYYSILYTLDGYILSISYKI